VRESAGRAKGVGAKGENMRTQACGVKRAHHRGQAATGGVCASGGRAQVPRNEAAEIKLQASAFIHSVSPQKGGHANAHLRGNLRQRHALKQKRCSYKT